MATNLAPVATDEIEDYPLGPDDRLDTHYFIAWERRRWLNSEMRLKGSAECRALYFDLICISYDQSPIGTLPNDRDLLARMLMVDRGHFEQLCRMDYGPLHRWSRCRCRDEIRLYHPYVLRTLIEAISRREDNRARTEAANNAKRLQRLRSAVAGYVPDLAKNDAALLWMDEWLTSKNCGYRAGKWIEKAIREWSEHQFDLRGMRG